MSKNVALTSNLNLGKYLRTYTFIKLICVKYTAPMAGLLTLGCSWRGKKSDLTTVIYLDFLNKI